MTVVIADNQIRVTTHDRDRPRFTPQPDAPDIDDEMRVVDRLKADGLMTTAYSRAAGPGSISSSTDPASTPSVNESTPSHSRSRPGTARRCAQQLPVAAPAHPAQSPQATSPTTGLSGDRTIERCDNGRTWARPSSASPPHVHR